MKYVSLSIKITAGLCLAFLLMLAGNLQAQTIVAPADLYKNSGDPLQGTSTNDGNTIICANAATFTLVSTTADASSVPYTSWKWEEMQTDGSWSVSIDGGGAVAGEEHKLRMTGAAPGWHVYRVTAAVSTAGCLADPVLYTVFVLPPLAVEAKANKATLDELTYCAENGAPTSASPGGTIKFTATPSITTALRAVPGSTGGGTTLPTLALADFKINYKWFKVEDGGDPTGTEVGSNDDEYEVNDAATSGATAVKKYTYRLEADYAVKACDTKNVTAVLSGGTGNAIITVTPKPGAPTITIE
ncbi:hypothetical protein [Chitinophaga alhagiae]|uniref:hypothetical protein n=1 Tax=Chitinophaga alhagiae TaxID=2203219 RepID=UPI000E5AC380|nr:hypothetical protein [Chitinophaga alhagiae]